MWAVVFFRKVSEADAARGWSAHLCKKSAGLVVGKVTTSSTDSVLERIGVGPIHQFVMVIICFDCDVFTTPYMSDQFVSPRAKISDDGCTFSSVACNKCDVVRTRMRDGHREDGQIIPHAHHVKGVEIRCQLGI